jgi:hypothetical protein
MISKQALDLVSFLENTNGVKDKSTLIEQVQENFHLTKDRSIYYSDTFAVRFSSSTSNSFSNTVLSLSNLQKYDEMPFFVCLLTPTKNVIYLANSTFLQKISHSSQQLRVDNIRGSFNGSDIMKSFNGFENAPKDFQDLYAIHEEVGFSGNLVRLVEATTGISPSGKKYIVSGTSMNTILEAPQRAKDFVSSADYIQLKKELDYRVEQYQSEIIVASFIENVNIRGRVIEYIIAGDNDEPRTNLLDELRGGTRLSRFKTKNDLGDYTRIFDDYNTATDVKTKIMVLKSNPKAYNLDKMLEYLAEDKSVFLFYFVGIEPNKIVAQSLVSVFQKDLLSATILLKHWAGRNSRGVAQFHGETIHKLILTADNEIDLISSEKYLKQLIDLV